MNIRDNDITRQMGASNDNDDDDDDDSHVTSSQVVT